MPPAPPSWVDLLDVHEDDHVLLLDASSRRAEAALRRRVRHLHVHEVDGSAAGGPWGAFDLPSSADDRWDVVCLDAVDVRRVPDEVWSRLAASARVVVVGDNLLSPVRLADRVLRRRRGAGGRIGPGSTIRRLRERGLPAQQLFGLLRSSSEPVVAFDALAASSLPAVWGATLAHVHGRRRTAMNAAARLSGRQMLRLCPAWVVVAGPTIPGPADRVVAKVSNRDSPEIKFLRGEPIYCVERQYLVSGPAAEVAALQELEDVGFRLAPQLLPGGTPTSSRTTWMDGAPLPVGSLPEPDMVRWVSRAAQVLAELQRLTRAPDGTVLVHGDLWLGNLLVQGDDVTAVIDWAKAHRGSPEVDREFLVTSLERWITSAEMRRALEVARDAAYAKPV